MKPRKMKTGGGPISRNKVLKVLLLSGVISSLLYISIDIIGGILWEGYSFISQPISALAAIGSPVRTLTAPLFIIYAAFLLAFGLGVRMSAGRNRALRITGSLLILIGIVGFMWTPFPMSLDEPVSSPANTMHSVFAAIQVLLILLTIGFGAAAYSGRFRLYSIGTILMLLVAGFAGFWMASAEQSISWFGVIERINVYGYLLWISILSVTLLRGKTNKN